MTGHRVLYLGFTYLFFFFFLFRKDCSSSLRNVFISVTEIILCFQNTDNVNFYNILAKEVPEMKSDEQENLHLSKLYLNT